MAAVAAGSVNPFLAVFDIMRTELPPIDQDDNVSILTYFSDKGRSELDETTKPIKVASRKIIETEDRIRILHECAEYFRSLEPASGSNCFVENNMLPLFMRHLTASKDLLLKGPPGSGSHTINPEKAAEWVAAQKSTKRRELAQKIIDNAIYITHTDLLKALQDCVGRVAAKCDFSRPVVLLSGLPKKSNYYISLLFAHFWLERGHRIDYVLEHFGKIDMKKYIFNEMCANILDVDDMAYSGTQTFQLMAQVFNIIKRRALIYAGMAIPEASLIVKDVKCPMCYFEVPLFYFEYLIRAKMKTNYLLCRAFCSSEAYDLFTSMVLDTGIRIFDNMPAILIFHRRIPSAKEALGKNNMKKAAMLFQEEVDDVAAITYLNHKIADPPSTFLHPLVDGRIPGRFAGSGIFLNKSQLPPNIVKANNGVTNIDGNHEYKRFIEGCMNGPQPLNEENESGLPVLSDEKRCPYAWYKSINYNTGTYSPPATIVPAGGAGVSTRRTRHGRRRTRRIQKSR